MDREAFTVLPPLSPRLPPPPPTPAPTRVAPITVAHKESSAFVIISELKSGSTNDPSGGRSSPFRGRGFREPSPSRIPVASGRSAPASPARKAKPIHTISTAGGKSAPASPKRVTTRPPQVPRNVKKGAENSRRNNNNIINIRNNNNNNNNAVNTKAQMNNKPTTTITSNKPPLSTTRKKPTPAVRNKISGKTKPISTEVTIGSLGKDRFVKPSAPTAAPRKSTEKNGAVSEKSETKTDAENKTNDSSSENKKEPASAPPKEKPNVFPDIKDDKPPESIESSPPDHVTIVETQQSKIESSKIQQSSEPRPDSPPVVSREKKTVIAEVTSAPMPSTFHKTTLHVEADVREIPVHAMNGLSLGQKLATTSPPLDEHDQSDATTDKVDATLVEWTTKHPKELAQPDIIPNDDVMAAAETIEEVTTTVQGPAEVEVEAGNHTVKFRSPEIHPVSPRVKKQGLYRRLKDSVTGCVKIGTFRRRKVTPVTGKQNNKNKEKKKAKSDKKEGKNQTAGKTKQSEDSKKNNVADGTTTDNNKKSNKFSTKMAALSKFNNTNKKKEPPPPRLPGAETNNKSKAKSKLSLLNRLNCLKKKEGVVAAAKAKPTKAKPKLRRSQATAQPGGRSCWRKIFCLDAACCVKCQRNRRGLGAAGGAAMDSMPPPPKAKKPEFKRTASVGGNALPKLDQTLVEHTSVMKAAIPVLPICLAWTCLILNVFLPGIGTVISGFLCTCFGKPRFSVNDSMRARLGSLSVNLVIGIGQLFTVIFCLVGWGWSIWWGIIMLKLARKNKRIKLAEKAGGTSTATPVNRNQSDMEMGGHQ